ncbi:MAG: AAA family ATPase [Planctomycetes bacterium]|nr:AAA family ATPase [Planctomycetota bacterium]
MPRAFNVGGPNKPEIHYTLDPEPRLPGLRALIDQQSYFVLHAPRQSGKTTIMDLMARKLTEEGKYTALRFSIEASRPFSRNVPLAMATALDSLRGTSRTLLPECLQPPAELFATIPEPASGLFFVLNEWARRCPRPIVLFIDEIDAIDAIEDDALIAVLHQLRNGYTLRPQGFPLSVALIGMRDVREYKARVRPDRETLGSASPFNIKAESLTLGNFTPAEVAALYRQHTDETGQEWREEAVALACELTGGQPWLVNALARQVVEKVAPDRATAITPDHVQEAKEILILRRDTHLDSLAERLHEERIRRVIEPVLIGGFTGADVYNDDLLYVSDLGLITRPPAQIRIANPIYAEVIPRALTFVLESNLAIETRWYVEADGRLDVVKLLGEFQDFFRQHGEMWLERYDYKEAGPHLVLYAWLQRVVNGAWSHGHLTRESAIGTGRADLLIEWPASHDPRLRRWPIPAGVRVQKEALEVKVRAGEDPERKGLEELGQYLSRLGLEAGHLVIFDRRPGRSWEEKVFRREGVALPGPFRDMRAVVWGV